MLLVILWKFVSLKTVMGEGVNDMVLFLVCLQILSNGKYKSAQHRAITNVTQARLSVATFHDLATVKISPTSELVGESAP